MGDRICITFINDEYLESKDPFSTSPCLYAQHDGLGLIELAKEFYEKYKDQIRRVPSNWMFNFIQYINCGVGDGNYYLHPFESCSAWPDDRGFYRFNTDNGVITHLWGNDDDELIGGRHSMQDWLKKYKL